MSHITEGLLHAHLDGALGPDEQLAWSEAAAHLEVCEDCRRRLAEAAELREAASSLLAEASSVGAAPPRPSFDDLVAQAEARKAGSRKSAAGPRARARAAWWRSPSKLAWAASLTLAVGAGWIGRQLMVEEGAEFQRSVPEEVAESAPQRSQERDLAAEGLAGNRLEAREDAAAPAAQERQRAADELVSADADDAADGAADDAADPGAARRAEAPAAALSAAKVAAVGRCYTGPGVGGELADNAAFLPASLVLDADGTVALREAGQSWVGFWEAVGADSVRVRATDGEDWTELRLERSGENLVGVVASSDPPAPVSFEASSCPDS